jgi:hypothetical protein
MLTALRIGNFKAFAESQRMPGRALISLTIKRVACLPLRYTGLLQIN